MLNEAGKLISSDNSNEINDIVKAQYYHFSGNFNKSNEILNALFKEEDKIFPWVYDYSKYLRVVNFNLLNDFDSEKKLKLELKYDFKEYYNKIFNNHELSKNLLKFREHILINEFQNAEKIKENLLNNKLNDAQQAFVTYYDGIQNFKEKKLLNAEKYFMKSKSLDNEIFGNDINRYLVHIYKTTNANKNNVENLIDELNDLDDERLELSVEELEEKYDL
jgi:hypothetical protein